MRFRSFAEDPVSSCGSNPSTRSSTKSAVSATFMVAALSSLNVFSLSGTQSRVSLFKDKIKDLEAIRRWLRRIASL